MDVAKRVLPTASTQHSSNDSSVEMGGGLTHDGGVNLRFPFQGKKKLSV